MKISKTDSITLARSLAVMLALLWFISCGSSRVDGAHRKRVFCRHVIDGDTIVLSDGRKVRYLEINAPEIAHRDSPGEPYGRQATYLNRMLVEGKAIDILPPSSEPFDQYGRLLAHVFLPNGKLVSEVLVRKGLAHVCFYAQPDNYSRRLLSAQESAIRARRGIWSIRHRDLEPFYIGNKRSRRFHRPWCPLGKRTLTANKVIFRNRKNAFLRGYCPCKKCRP